MQETSNMKVGCEDHHVLSCSLRPASMDRRLNPPMDSVLKCPRCDSFNTKFCYYNNYSLSQPRHFCKNCRRYWTKGGALRNVPVGGGCRKNKRIKQRSSTQEQSSKPSQPIVFPITGDTSNFPSLPDPPCSPFFTLPDIEASEITLNSLAKARAQPSLEVSDQVGVNSFSAHGHFGASAQRSMPSLSQLSKLASLHSGLMGLDFNAAIRNEHGNVGGMYSTPQQLNLPSEACAPLRGGFNLALEGPNGMNRDIQWRMPQQKMESHKEGSPKRDRHAFMHSVTSDHNEKAERIRALSYRPASSGFSQYNKMEEGKRQKDDWNCGQGLFEGIGEQTYWNYMNGTWSDFSPAYGPSASPLL